MAAMPMSRLRRTVVGVVMALGLAVGCTSSTSPGEAVPELRRTLTKVDQAIVEQRYERAGTRLHELVQATTAAREEGTLDASAAEPILAAAASLLSALPASEDHSEDSSPAPDPDDDDNDAGDIGRDEDRHQEQDQDEHDEDEEEQEEKEGDRNGKGNGGRGGGHD